MQQIESRMKNKEVPDLERFFICNNHMVREVDYRWNQLEPSLRLMHEKLVRFGLMRQSNNNE